MGLARETGGVDFIVQGNNDARIARGLLGPDLDGAENIRGAVGPRPGRIAHGPCDHNRQGDIEHEVERKRRLFHAVGALSDPGARDSAGRKVADFVCRQNERVEIRMRAGNGAMELCPHVGETGQLRRRADQFLGAWPGHNAHRAFGHCYGPARRQNVDIWLHWSSPAINLPCKGRENYVSIESRVPVSLTNKSLFQ